MDRNGLAPQGVRHRRVAATCIREPRPTSLGLRTVVVALALVALSGCVSRRSTEKTPAELRNERLDAMVDDTIAEFPDFPSESAERRKDELGRLRASVEGCKTEDGTLVVCYGLIAWIYDGDQHELEKQKVRAFVPLAGPGATSDRSVDGRFQKFSASDAKSSTRYVVLTKRSPSTATAACHISDSIGDYLCTTLVNATAHFGRAEVGRVVAGNLGLTRAVVDTPHECSRSDKPGTFTIACPNRTAMTFGRVQRKISATGMRVLLANLSERAEQQAAEEGAVTSKSDATSCDLDGKAAECIQVTASLAGATHRTIIAASLIDDRFLKCSHFGDGIPEPCRTLLAWSPPTESLPAVAPADDPFGVDDMQPAPPPDETAQ